MRMGPPPPFPFPQGVIAWSVGSSSAALHEMCASHIIIIIIIINVLASQLCV